MRIGILGSGNMGRSLGMRWAEAGHEVFFGGRDAEKARQTAVFVGLGAQGGGLAEAARFGEVLLHTARDATLADMLGGTAGLDDKIIVELNNRPIPEGFAFEPVTESYAERLQAEAPDARVVKAFNLFAMEVFEHSAESLAAEQISLFLAGDDAEAKRVVGDLGAALGFTPVDGGPLRNTRLLESMGDFIRYLIIAEGHGPFATLSLRTLPPSDGKRLGGRQASNFG